MRIIERTHPNGSIVYVVQEEDQRAGLYNQLNSASFTYVNKFKDIKSFTSVVAAREFMQLYKDNLQPGERIVG